MALSEYFPYGAPELLEGADERMARSVLGASLGVMLTAALLGFGLARGLTPAPAHEPEFTIHDLLPPMDVPPEPVVRQETPVAPPRATFDEQANPVLVKDEVVKEWEFEPPMPPQPGTGETTGRTEPGGIGGTGSVSQARDPELFEFVVVDEEPVLIRCAEARYPDLARAAGVEGLVHVRMLVGPSGRVERAIVVPGGSVPMLDEAALEAARTCVFTPALTNGHPVKVWVSQTYRFTLH